MQIMSLDKGIQCELLDDNETSKQETNNITGDTDSHKGVSSLKADIWCLKLSLTDSLQCSNNLQTVLTNTIQEKYELIEEIHNLHKLNQELLRELSCEREKLTTERRNLLNEMYEVRDELNNSQNSMAIMNTECCELKKSLYKAQETIHKLGNMFLKLKSMKNCSGNLYRFH